jgi:CRISPR-associated protein Csm2
LKTDREELVGIFSKEEITDFSELKKKWEEIKKRLKEKELKEVAKDLEDKLKNHDIKKKKLIFLSETPEKVLSTAWFLAGLLILKDLKRSQIRKILDMMKDIKRKGPKIEELKKDIAKIRYLLAYAVGRNKNVEPLYSVFDPLFAEIKDFNDFEKVYEFMQSIVAFHYFLGGGE